jgi:hypothetical protein
VMIATLPSKSAMLALLRCEIRSGRAGAPAA